MVKKTSDADADAEATRSSGNVFVDLGFAPGVTPRADLDGWTQAI